MSLIRRLERLEGLAEQLLGGDRCPECDGPVPHESPPVVRTVYPDGREVLDHVIVGEGSFVSIRERDPTWTLSTPSARRQARSSG